ncbi:MAG: tyrosine-protein phosphatase [Alphaproteobacteria bacterium]|nr:tyrosine-protein phosphatase [Alphaproteobacteria bacterium]
MSAPADAAPADARHHRVDGVSNFRDFGGYATARGAPMRSGRFYRSSNLAGLTAKGRADLAARGIATVIDLRGVQERGRIAAPALDDHGIAVVAAPIEPRTTSGVRALLAEGRIGGSQMRSLMIATYRGFVADEAAAFGSALAAMMAAGGRPLLVHCTAGKDRTGFLVALIHALLGVARDAILADYAATNAAWDRASVSDLLRHDAAAVEPLLTADPDYLAAAFAEIERIDGSPQRFLARATAGRVTPDRFDTWTFEERPS